MGALENMQARAVEMAGPEPVETSEANAPETAPAAGPAAAEGTTPETTENVDPEQAVRDARRALLSEKLAESREKRNAQRLEERARAERKAAKADREAAAAERRQYEGLKQGSFKETITKLGHDPAKVFQEMQREAVEASDPDAIARKNQEAIQATIREQKERIDALERERQETIQRESAQRHQAGLQRAFQTSLADPQFKDLRIEYPDEALLDHAQYYDKHPQELFAHARTHGVRLTAPGKGFTMHELLQVLSAAQAAHNAAKQARQAAMSPAPADAGEAPTVNGTAARRNAGTVTNELAQTRASSGPVETGSVRDRIRARVDQEVGKHR